MARAGQRGVKNMQPSLQPKKFQKRSLFIFLLLGPLLGGIGYGMLAHPFLVLMVYFFGGAVAMLAWAIYYGAMISVFWLASKSERLYRFAEKKIAAFGMVFGSVAGAIAYIGVTKTLPENIFWSWIPGLVCGGLSINSNLFNGDGETEEDAVQKELRRQETLKIQEDLNRSRSQRSLGK